MLIKDDERSFEAQKTPKILDPIQRISLLELTTDENLFPKNEKVAEFIHESADLNVNTFVKSHQING